MRRKRFLRRCGAALTTLLVAGTVGFQLRDVPRGTDRTFAGVLPDLDFFVRPRSFSEIENTRAELEGLALRFRTQTRMRQVETKRSDPAQVRAAAITELEQGIAEFKETPEEFYLAQDLLLLLRAQGQNDRWLDVYLEILYRRPTQDLLATFLETARRLAQVTGRENEVAAGFRHLLEIPLEFPAKRLLQDAQAQAALKATPSAPIL